MPSKTRTNAPKEGDRASETWLDRGAPEETVITLSNNADRQRLRAELLRLILKSEGRRRQERLLNTQDAVTTDGSANSQVGTAEA